MIKKQQKQLAIQNAVMAVMEKNRSTWQSVAELSHKYDRYIRNLKKTEDYFIILQTDLSPLKLKRKSARKILIDRLFPVTSVLAVFANDTGDRKLAKTLINKVTELEKMNSNSLSKYGIRILKTSGRMLNPQPAQGRKGPKRLISDYGVTGQHLESMKDALDNFIRADVDLKETRMFKKKSKARLKKRIRYNKEMLVSIDRMIHLFRDSHKHFYNAYIKARIPAEEIAAPPVPKVEPVQEAVTLKKEPVAPVQEAGTLKKEPVATKKEPEAPKKSDASSKKGAAGPKKRAVKPGNASATASRSTARRPVGRPRKTPAKGNQPSPGKPASARGRNARKK